MTTQFIAGIDPGFTGYLAVVRREDGDQYPALAFAMPIPTVTVRTGRTKKERPRYDTKGILAAMRAVAAFEPTMVILEEAQGRGNQVGGAQLSYGLGLLRMAAEAAGLPVTLVPPSRWKHEMRCPSNKRAATKLALSLLQPTAQNPFAGPHGGTIDGKAEAALLAIWGLLNRGAPEIET